MKTLDEALQTTQGNGIDNRNLTRLAMFVPVDRLHEIGVELNEDAEHTPLEFTRDNVLAQLKDDVAFGFEKALNQRGISAGLMYDVVQMWNRILQDGLEDFDDYAQYGLPLFKATAVKYGFDNPIGTDAGNEDQYAG